MLKHHLVDHDVLDLASTLNSESPSAATPLSVSPMPDAVVTGTTANDFIHMTGDGAPVPSGSFNEIITVTNGDDSISARPATTPFTAMVETM